MTPPQSSSSPNVAWILGQPGFPAAARDSHVALLWEGHELSYGDLRSRAQQLATGLRELGLSEGDRVASMLYNRGEVFELYFACAYAGLTFVPINFRMAPSELAAILTDCQAKVLFTSKEIEGTCAAAMHSMPASPRTVVLEDEDPGREYGNLLGTPIEQSRHTAVQLILYTSGTTGSPKGVPFTHSGVLWNAFEESALCRIDDRTRMLITAPLYNTAGINEFSIPTLFSGGTVAIMPSRGWSADRMSDHIHKWQIDHCLIFPSMMAPMLEADDRAKLPIGRLRHVLTGGENCPPRLLADFQKRWPAVNVIVGYGSTECGLVSAIEGEEIGRRPGSVGRVVPGHRVEIRGADGKPVTMGEIGEVWVASPAAINGYWEAPELSADVIRDGWVRSGDLARVDLEGFLYIEGRTKDLVISKGQNIYPAEVENALMRIDDIIDAAVIGLPDEEYGEAVCAVVVLDRTSRLTEQDILDQLRGEIASYKRPRRVLFRDQLPRNATQKVLKTELRRDCIAQLPLAKEGLESR